MLSGRVKPLLRQATGLWSRRYITQQPLLDDVELHKLERYSRSRLSQPLIARRDVQHLLLGERLSTFTGSGYEFAENRLFQAGDDARFINWRLYARSGELYRKVFHEERRPQLWLVVDRRNNMRFGTRKRLKVTAAVRQALVCLYQAQQQQISIGAVLLDQPLQWFEARSNNNAYQNIIEYLNLPCPPGAALSNESSGMDSVIRLLQTRLHRGSIVVLLSDFHDLEQSHLPYLHQLALQHSVSAVQVLDDIELDLPPRGRYSINSDNNSQSTLLDCDDDHRRQLLNQQLRLRQQQLEQWLTGCDVNYQLLLTSDEPFSVQSEVQRGNAR
jgi:uncharacterized protein (DUF58 family)